MHPMSSQKSRQVLIAALQDPYFKVRAAACTSVALMGESLAEESLPILTKLLRDGQLNKQTVAETIVNMGSLGE